jgi:hypothetical protein
MKSIIYCYLYCFYLFFTITDKREKSGSLLSIFRHKSLYLFIYFNCLFSKLNVLLSQAQRRKNLKPGKVNKFQLKNVVLQNRTRLKLIEREYSKLREINREKENNYNKFLYFGYMFALKLVIF